MPTLRKHSFPFYRLGASLGLGLLLALIAISTIHAQKPGDLDTTFGEDGIVTTTLGSPWEWGLGVAIQPDDEIVVVGERAGNNGVMFIVLRYTVTGTLDTTFNNTGYITTPIADFDSAYAAVVQPDGKIVAAGFSGVRVDDPYGFYSYYDYTFAAVRYTMTGTLDTTFNGSGVLTTSISNENTLDGNDDLATSVALQPDGKIVLAGQAGNADQDGSLALAVVRYTPTGTLDSTFNHTGIVTLSIGSDGSLGRGVAIQPDGKIVVAGSSGDCYYHAPDIGDFAIVRYTITGSLDTSFNNTGIVTTPIGTGCDTAFSVAIQPDGKIVAAGYSEQDHSGNRDFAVARYTITGALDSTFNHTGIVTTSFASSQEGYRLAIQPDGKIVVVGGYSRYIDDANFTVIRYTDSGALDTSFNLTGIITTPIGDRRNDMAADVAMQSDGKIVVVGIDGEEGDDNDVNYDSNIAVVRYLNHWNTTVFVPVILKE